RNENKRAKVSKGFVASTTYRIENDRNQVTLQETVVRQLSRWHRLMLLGVDMNQEHAMSVGVNSRNNENQVKGRAFNVNAVGALKDPNVMTEVADGKKVEVDRFIRNCKLELGTSLFTVDLIPLGHGSFDVIVGMDWLSKHKAEIVCHEKVVRIPMESGEILNVQGEHTPGIAKALSNVKVDAP
nr:putative reverse transcriptase domain-containing protein [Tanacetum cinerariifolium]